METQMSNPNLCAACGHARTLHDGPEGVCVGNCTSLEPLVQCGCAKFIASETVRAKTQRDYDELQAGAIGMNSEAITQRVRAETAEARIATLEAENAQLKAERAQIETDVSLQILLEREELESASRRENARLTERADLADGEFLAQGAKLVEAEALLTALEAENTRLRMRAALKTQNAEQATSRIATLEAENARLLDALKAQGDSASGHQREVGRLAEDKTRLRSALTNLYALVQGEAPGILKDDHHDELVRAAIKETAGGVLPA